MNIVRENLKDQTALLKVTVEQADYNDAVEKVLRDYKRKANVPGFRPGMVPMGIVNKMYRKGVTAEEAYKCASEAASKYMEENKIDFIGEILPSEEQKQLDFENDTQHEFIFEFAESPKVEIVFGADDKLTKYNIKVDKSMQEGYRTNYLRRFGRLVDVDKVENEEALTVTLDNESMNIADAYVGLISMAEEARKPFIGKKVGDVMDVDVTTLYPNPAQRASILQIKEEELAALDPKFKLTITKIRKFAEPEMNDEFFKMAFPDGSITTAEGFDKFVDEQIAAELAVESGYLFAAELRDALIAKANISLPADFVKRWLFVINQGKFAMEDIEKDLDAFLDMLRWSIIRNHYVKEFDLKIGDEDIINEAKSMARAQFAQYGMSSVGDDMLANYAQTMLKNREELQKIHEKVVDTKVIEAVGATVKTTDKSVSVEEYGKIVEQRNKRAEK